MFHGKTTTSSASAATIPTPMAKSRQRRFGARACLLGISRVHAATPKILVASLGERCQHNAPALWEIVLNQPVSSVCPGASAQRMHDDLAAGRSLREAFEPSLDVR